MYCFPNPHMSTSLSLPRVRQQRREKDEYRLSKLREEMEELEKTVTAETQRREEMGKSLQSVSGEFHVRSQRNCGLGLGFVCIHSTVG